MDPHAFVAEVYRRMSLRQLQPIARETWAGMQKDPAVLQAEYEYAPLLPADNVRDWSPAVAALHEIESNIADFLAGRKESYDFIHMSHVIEHIPKYSLLYAMDALFWALKPNGCLLLRTPNMEGPCALSSFYVTLAHEYGFAASNLRSLLNICSFEDIRFHLFRTWRPSLKQRAGEVIRWPIVRWNAARHRLFGGNYEGQFGAELIVSARKGALPPFFDPKYK